MIKRRLLNAFGALALMTGATIAAAYLTPSTHYTDIAGQIDLEQLIPNEFGEWRRDTASTDYIVDPQQQNFIKSIYSQTLNRSYYNSHGQRVMLSIAYGEDQRREASLHYPELCYRAQGFSIRNRHAYSLALADGDHPTIRMATSIGSDRYEPVTYWVVIGVKKIAGSLSKKIALYSYGIQGMIPDGLIFRVSSIGTNDSQEFANQAAFISALSSALKPSARDRIFGVQQ